MSNYTNALTFLLCLVLCSCGRKHPGGGIVPQRGTPAKEQAAGMTTNGTNRVACSDENASSSAAQQSVDKLAKATDEFSDALNLQSARFGYDTNMVLTAAHTNYLMSLPMNDFRDFMCQFKNAIRSRALQPGELALLFAMTMERINTGLGSMEWSYVSDNLCDLTEIAGQHNDATVMDIPGVWLEYACKQASLTKDLRWFSQALAGITFPLMDLQNESMAGEYANACSRLIEQYRKQELLAASPEDDLRLRFTAACVKGYTDPTAALAELGAMESDYNTVFQGSQARRDAFKWSFAGVRRGLLGKDLLRYVRDQERAPMPVSNGNKTR